jgi:cation transport regulator ChaB
MMVMTLDAVAKRIAVRYKLKAADVRAVLASRKSDLPRAVVSQITEMARTLIHEELVRLDAKRHPANRKDGPNRREGSHKR